MAKVIANLTTVGFNTGSGKFTVSISGSSDTAGTDTTHGVNGTVEISFGDELIDILAAAKAVLVSNAGDNGISISASDVQFLQYNISC